LLLECLAGRKPPVIKRIVRKPFISLPLSSAVLYALAGTSAGWSQGLIAAPPVGIAAHPSLSAAPGGTVTTPVTPSVPRGRTPGQSTITVPGVSGSGAISTKNSGAVRPCGGGSNATGAIPGNAGIVTAHGSNPNNVATGVPSIPAGGPPDSGTRTNPSVRAGVPSSC
jgi:hypothetical protein